MLTSKGFLLEENVHQCVLSSRLKTVWPPHNARGNGNTVCDWTALSEKYVFIMKEWTENRQIHRERQ